MAEDATLDATDRSRLRRKRERGSHGRRVIDAILDEGLVCHVGFSHQGATYVVPTAYGRVGDVLYLHGAPANQMLGALASGSEICVTVTILDGLVLARSAKHHSLNFRSVMLFGAASTVDDPAVKRQAALAVVDHIVPGRSTEARSPSEEEMRATRFLSFPIVEGSAKIRTGGPIDDDADLDLPVWAGQLPLSLAAGVPVPEGDLPPGVAVPASLRQDRFTSLEPI